MKRRGIPGRSRVVGLDQSYIGFGYCVDGESKKKAFPPHKYDGDVHRLWNIREWFKEWLNDQAYVTGLDKGRIDLVVMEGYANAAKFGREQAGELGGVVKMAIYDVLGPGRLVIVPPTTLKKFVSGSGGAKKNTMLMHVYRQWGVQFSDDNQADAYSLEQFGHAYLGLVKGHVEPRGMERSWHKYQVEAVEAVRKAQ